MGMRLGGRIAAAGFCAATLLAGATAGEAAKGFKVLYSFSGLDGNRPVAPLYLGAGNAGTLYGTTQLGGGNGAGTVFAISQRGLLKSLYDFQQAPDGNAPDGGVAVENNGDVYGSTQGGGPEKDSYPGTIYKVSPKGRETILYSFCRQTNCTDGTGPNSTLVADDRESGFLYGTTGSGGNGWGTLFQISTGGQMNPSFYVFCRQANCADGSTPIGAPYVINPTGFGDVVYGATSTGGANGYGVVYSMDYNGNYFVLCNFDYTHGAYPQGGVILDKKNNIIGVAGGGDANNGVVYKLPNQGGVPKVLYSFGSGTDGQSPVGELVSDSNGNFYGVTTYGGDYGQGTVYKLTPKGKETVLYSFNLTSDGGDPMAGLYGVYSGTNGTTLTLYGTTSTGGSGGDGTVFKFEL